MTSVGSFNIPVVALAERFLVLGSDDPSSRLVITHLKLHNLIYIANAFSIVNLGSSLIYEDFVAFRNGPVCRKLDYEYRRRQSQILAPAPGVHDTYREARMVGADEVLARKIADVVKATWNVFGHYRGPELDDLNSRTTPFRIARAKRIGAPVDKQDIRRYYRPFKG